MTQGTQAIDRAASILSFVVRAEDPVAFSEVVDVTGLARSTVSRLLQALERNGLLERDPEGRYRGGALFAGYAAKFDRLESLILAAEPTLRRIGTETGETVNLAVPSGRRVVHVAQVSSTFVLGATNWVDVEVPPHCSALGKVMYAYGVLPAPDGEVERKTPRTLGSVSALAEDLNLVRENGFAVTCEEFEEGLDAVAAPVHGAGEAVVAAIGVSGPSVRFAQKHARLGELLIREAAELTRSLQVP